MALSGPTSTVSAGIARRTTGVGAIVGATATSPTAYTNTLTRWISQHCTPTPPREWSSASYATQRPGAWELFSCATHDS